MGDQRRIAPQRDDAHPRASALRPDLPRHLPGTHLGRALHLHRQSDRQFHPDPPDRHRELHPHCGSVSGAGRHDSLPGTSKARARPAHLRERRGRTLHIVDQRRIAPANGMSLTPGPALYGQTYYATLSGDSPSAPPYTLTVKVTDSSTPTPRIATESFTLTVARLRCRSSRPLCRELPRPELGQSISRAAGPDPSHGRSAPDRSPTG